MRVITSNAQPEDIKNEVRVAEQLRGRRFGHPGEWRYGEWHDDPDDEIDWTEEELAVESGVLYGIRDPISDICMVGLDQQVLADAWLTLLEAYATPRSKLRQNVRFAVFSRDAYRCRVCGAERDRDGVRLHVDHILPVFLGGNDHPDNLRTLCDTCNTARGSNLAFGMEEHQTC